MVQLTVHADTMTIDFQGTAPACAGPLNAPRAVTESAVLYALRTLDGDDMPASAGAFRPLQWHIPPGSLLNPPAGVAVAGGNVETSQRVVDVIYRALAQAIPHRIPAQSTGTMNNWTMGGTRVDGTPFAYYETLGGGMGARSTANGLTAVQTHMTNTRNTPIELFERIYPVRVHALRVRAQSGGDGQYVGGDGLHKSIEFLVPTMVTLLTERRVFAPAGACGGADGRVGANTLVFPDGMIMVMGKGSVGLPAGARLTIETPGGGGYGEAV
jgi:N-methylhydantoinase B